MSGLTDARHITSRGQQVLAPVRPGTRWRSRRSRRPGGGAVATDTRADYGDEQWENWRYWHQDDFDGPEAYQVTDYSQAFSQREAHPGVAVQVMHKRTWRVRACIHQAQRPRNTPLARPGRPARRSDRRAQGRRQLGYPEW